MVLARVQRRLLQGVMLLPPELRGRLLGPPPRNDRGVPLDADLHVLIWLEQRLPQPPKSGSPAAARASMRLSLRTVQGRERPEVAVRSCQVAGRPCRLYRPPGRPEALLVYLHGGGWVVGDLDTHDRLCRRLAQEAARVVLSVDYRLAPEHPFPQGLDDCVAVTRAILADGLTGISPELPAGLPVEVGGDSAGGNLSAATCLVLRDQARRDRGGPLPARQLLIYPATDLRMQTASHRTLARGYLLDEPMLHWYREQSGVPDWTDPRASPLLAADHARLPPAIVVTAGFDPLRDEGEALAVALAAAGVPVDHLAEPALAHGFVNMDGVVPAADRAVGRICRALRSPPR